MLAGKGFTLSAEGSGTDKIFNREDELAALIKLFDSNPRDLRILLGPANCGKSKLLQQVKKDRELAQDVICEGPPPILYLDCRGKDISSPQQFANVIRELVAEDAALKNWLQAIKLNFPGTELDFENMFKPAADKARMASIIASLTKFLEAVRPQANVLMRWGDDPGHKQLKALLDFFVRTTKQEHLGHIVLASSESFVTDFLVKHGLHPNNFVARDIGNLATSDEAKKFVKYRKDCGDAPPDFFDTTKDGKKIDMWPRVYEVCGGNIGLLERCAGYAKDLGSWEEGLKEVSMGLEGAVKSGLWP
ncbi:putative ATP-binding protein [Nannochloris sp. 'desiccata']|nr:putative ATP-binding protein [Chlorella desiccata (nom. nud.)]